jgi:hypothetical protein
MKIFMPDGPASQAQFQAHDRVQNSLKMEVAFIAYYEKVHKLKSVPLVFIEN